MHTDLILMHAPSIYDFRKESILYGPMSDLVPSSPIFEMYPIGFLTMSNYLEKRGLKVRIINLAFLMMNNLEFDAEKYIKKLNPLAFGIDLHWLPHCQGSTEVAKIIKKYHPDIPVIFGGFSASYFYRELAEFDQVDFIVRGDSTEEPLYRLVKAIKELSIKKELPSKGIKWDTASLSPEYISKISSIPNLVYKNKDKIIANEIECISSDLEEIDFDYSIMFKQVIRHLDAKCVMPFAGWLKYPVTTIPIVRGCTKDCSGCGGSKNAFKTFAKRTSPAFRNPKKLVSEIKKVRRYIDAPFFILGDITQGGREYLEEFFREAKTLDPNTQIFFEFFEPPDNWFYDEVSKIFKNVCYEMSPDSHDEKIREKMGKSFTNRELVESIKYAFSKGALRFDLYFMTGLPGQTSSSIMDTVSFCEEVYEETGWDKRFMPFISPMAPFVDPGSRSFEHPEEFGYIIKKRTLKEHIEAIKMPSWKYILNYESKAITNDDLVEYTYKAALGLNRLKGKAGGIDKKTMEENEERTKEAMKIIKIIDDILKIEDKGLREKELKTLKDKTLKYSLSTVCEKSELEFPFTNKSFKWLSIAKATLLPESVRNQQNLNKAEKKKID